MSCAKYIIENYLSEKTSSYSNNVEKEVTNSIDQGLDKTLANILKHTEKSALNADLLAPFKSKKNENTLKFKLSESLRNKIISERSLHPMTSFSNVFGNGNNPQPKGTPIAQQYQNAKTGFKNFMQNKVNPLAQKVAKGVNQGAQQGIKGVSDFAMGSIVGAGRGAMQKKINPTPSEQPGEPKDNSSFAARSGRAVGGIAGKAVGAISRGVKGKEPTHKEVEQPTINKPNYDIEAIRAKFNQSQPDHYRDSMDDVRRNLARNQQQDNSPTQDTQQSNGPNSNVTKNPSKIRQAMDKWATNRAEMKDAKNAYKEKQRQQQMDNMRQYGVKSDKGIAKQQFKQQQQQQKLNDIKQYGSGISGWARKKFGQGSADDRRRAEMDKFRQEVELNMVKNMRHATQPKNFQKSFTGYQGVNPMLRDFKSLYGYGGRYGQMA